MQEIQATAERALARLYLGKKQAQQAPAQKQPEDDGVAHMDTSAMEMNNLSKQSKGKEQGTTRQMSSQEETAVVAEALCMLANPDYMQASGSASASAADGHSHEAQISTAQLEQPVGPAVSQRMLVEHSTHLRQTAYVNQSADVSQKGEAGEHALIPYTGPGAAATTSEVAAHIDRPPLSISELIAQPGRMPRSLKELIPEW